MSILYFTSNNFTYHVIRRYGCINIFFQKNQTLTVNYFYFALTHLFQNNISYTFLYHVRLCNTLIMMSYLSGLLLMYFSKHYLIYPMLIKLHNEWLSIIKSMAEFCFVEFIIIFKTKYTTGSFCILIKRIISMYILSLLLPCYVGLLFEQNIILF